MRSIEEQNLWVGLVGGSHGLLDSTHPYGSEFITEVKPSSVKWQ